MLSQIHLSQNDSAMLLIGLQSQDSASAALSQALHQAGQTIAASAGRLVLKSFVAVSMHTMLHAKKIIRPGLTIPKCHMLLTCLQAAAAAAQAQGRKCSFVKLSERFI